MSTITETEKFIANKQLLVKIEEQLNLQKEALSNFYKKNIGAIDKENSVSLEDYMVYQFNNPVSKSCTIKLHKNKYILQKKQKDGSFSYIPFEKRTTPIIPNDEDVLYMLNKEYTKFKPITKRQLITRVSDKHKENIKENKITKKEINSLSFTDLNDLFKSIGITELADSLRFYRLKESKTISLKRGLDDYTEKSDYFEEYKTINETIISSEANNTLEALSPLAKKIEKEIISFKEDIISKKNGITAESAKFISVSSDELLEKKFIPENTKDLKIFSREGLDFKDLKIFFKEGLDFHRIKQDIFSNKLALDLKISFIFHQPCTNLSEVDDRFNSIQFASSQNLDFSNNYQDNEILQLN